MASARASVLRHLTSFGCQARTLRASNQRRWAQVHDVRFLATTQHSRSVIEKYRDKLDRKAREEGVPDIDALKKVYADKIEALRKQADAEAAAAAPATAPATSGPSPPPPAPVPSPAAAPSPLKSKSNGSGIKPLSSILDLPKAQTLPLPELTAIWRLRHAHVPHSLCAAIPASAYTAMTATARAYPQFVLPVPHPAEQGGAEMHFVQWAFDASTRTSSVLFTQLAEYKARGEFAQPHTTITHHEDFVGDPERAVALMQGAVVENRGVSVEDAQWLVMSLQRFYGGWDGVGGDGARERAERRRRLVEMFGKGDARFDVQELIEEAERIG
ncbi:ATP11 protein-domain-containing protein [Podospora appendiculata]|uniref:ATP11 protein-domain-containing protein n=1 Tax=Podospora appendiculata TaxID=314037 RepID=A0AAE0XIH0_9PEZI|nr:ATP11 protein-domain-containing protein [Podospora appendiculata]